MKAVVVYYSLEGNTKYVADYLHKKFGVDLLELKPLKDFNPRGWLRFLIGGFQVIFKFCPVLHEYSFSADKYETIVLATPVWAGTFAPSIRTFLKENNLKNKKVAFCACHNGSAGHTFQDLKLINEKNTILEALELVLPLSKKSKEKDKLIDIWAKKFFN